ncbi:hypothetical protein SDC9_179762 [bioreactor metagenome]|uniref:Uncharacterized protein n=1 Tax=bioreactor metagenome TaxID=1076179 RepID=A0A645H7N3_9ZZZZ
MEGEIRAMVLISDGKRPMKLLTTAKTRKMLEELRDKVR